MERLFSGFAVRTPDAGRIYAALTRREFYEGDLESATGDFNSVELDKALSAPLSITRLKTRTELTFRRTSQHIRRNRVGLRVLWFVQSGSLKIVRATGTCEIKAGQAGILDSNVPFVATLKASHEGEHCSYQVIIPPDLFIAHLQEAERFSDPFSLASPSGQIAREILEIIVQHGSTLGEKVTQSLTHAMLDAVGDHLRDSGIELPRRQKLVDRRLADIENYIKMNLDDPELSCEKVAFSCGISPRYLCFLLKSNNTSFSELVWQNRLSKARDWLVSRKTRDYPIHEIAYMSGFKSAAHFSRMFRSAFGMPPREYRALHLQQNAQGDTSTCAGYADRAYSQAA